MKGGSNFISGLLSFFDTDDKMYWVGFVMMMVIVLHLINKIFGTDFFAV